MAGSFSRLRDVTDLVLFEVAEELDDADFMSAILTSSVSKSLVDRSAWMHEDMRVEDFRVNYWRAECLSKYPFDIPGIDRAAVALDGFHAAEQRCEQANLRLGFYPNPYCATSKVVRKARAKLKWLLSGISRDEVMHAAHWGPGASTSLPRKYSSPQNKWEFGAHVTSSALPWLLAFGKWSGQSFKGQIVCGNNVVTVPKNAKTDRTIAIEPDWNCFFQLGLGTCIRRRLNRVGLLYPDAQERNKRLAQAGSLTGLFATVDLKAASDTLSLSLCDLLLPSDLKAFINELRSPEGVLSTGEKVVYEKVSSMGNGFTFELETAMFWALASSCDPSGDAAVYGDDVILSVGAVPLFVEALTDLGMEVNQKKTHVIGPFRESCGGHYFNGVDVTPPYFKERVCDAPSYIRAHNKLSSFFGRGDATEYLRKKIPKFLWGPASRGDTVLASEWDEVCPTWVPDTQSYEMKELVETRKSLPSNPRGALLHATWGASYVSRFPSRERVIRVQRYTADRF
jgi:hypothetical protein